MIRKCLILICALSTVAGCDTREPVDTTEGAHTFVELALVMHENHDQVAEACGIPVDEDEQLEGCALFMHRPNGTSDCEVHIVHPSYVDDEETLTLGHEVLHCVYGLYHE